MRLSILGSTFAHFQEPPASGRHTDTDFLSSQHRVAIDSLPGVGIDKQVFAETNRGKLGHIDVNCMKRG
jgi:hypothetical protein